MDSYGPKHFSRQMKLAANHVISIKGRYYFLAARDTETGNISLFLYFKIKEKVYKRNGLRQAWEEVRDKKEKETVIQNINKIIKAGLVIKTEADVMLIGETLILKDRGYCL